MSTAGPRSAGGQPDPVRPVSKLFTTKCLTMATTFRLDAPDICRSQGSGQVRVFPERLGLPSAQRRARDVQRRPEQDIMTG